jgi:hypothetical protein
MARISVLDRAPPKDPETERKLLGAVLVSDDDATPDESLPSLSLVFEKVQAEDFSDPFYAWLFGVIAESRRVWPTLDKQLRFILARPNRHDAREKFGVEHLPSAIASLIMTRDGSGCCGRVASVRLYVNHLRQIRAYRERVEAAIVEIREAYEHWDNAARDGFTAPE